jgi:hypothetical protein
MKASDLSRWKWPLLAAAFELPSLFCLAVAVLEDTPPVGNAVKGSALVLPFSVLASVTTILAVAGLTQFLKSVWKN